MIGGAAGAVPPIAGWTAVMGSIDLPAIYLFAIIFFWTPPHFWALAVYKYDDYLKADVPMLPITHGKDFARLHIFLYSILLFCITLFPYLLGFSGLIYLIGSFTFGVKFIVDSYLLMVLKLIYLQLFLF